MSPQERSAGPTPVEPGEVVGLEEHDKIMRELDELREKWR